MLTVTEKALLKVALKYKKACVAAYPPEVITPTVEDLLERVVQEAQTHCMASIVPSPKQWAEILSDYK